MFFAPIENCLFIRDITISNEGLDMLTYTKQLSMGILKRVTTTVKRGSQF